MHILFLCTGNSCRSQMAEGWASYLHGEVIEAYSAGIEKHGMNPMAVKIMAEAGVDISGQRSKVIAELPTQRFDWVVTLCDHASEACPHFSGRMIHKGFADPPKLAAGSTSAEEALRHYQRVRDEIRAFIETLPGLLQAEGRK